MTRVRARAIVCGVLSGLAVCAVTPYNNTYLGATLLGGGHFPLAPFFAFVCLALLTAVVTRIFRKAVLFTGSELLTVWILMVVVSGIPYTGLARTFFVNLTAPFYFATAGNRWAEVLQPLLPQRLYPQDPEAIRQLYDGLDGSLDMTWGQLIAHLPWSAWLPPLLWWGGFILLAYLVMLCLTNLLARQWVENERINFPLMQLPQAMSEALDQQRLFSFLTDRYLLMGFFAASALHLVNGLAGYFPEIPQIPTIFYAAPYFPKFGLFSGFYKLRIAIYPAFIGFAFLTTRQISFSLWFFFLLGTLATGVFDLMGLSIPAAALGVTFGPTLAEVAECQMIGAYLVFFGFIIWLARYHLLAVLRIAFTGRHEAVSPAEWVSLRIAFWGAVAGFAGLEAWLCFFGMRPLEAFVTLGAFFVFTLVATRIITQGGIAYFTLTAAPLDAVLTLTGARAFAPIGLLLAAVAQKVLFVDLRESLMPSLMHAAKAEEVVGRRRLFLTGLILVIVLGVAVSLVAVLALGYKFGFREMDLDWATRTTNTVYENVQRLIEAPTASRSFVTAFAWAGAVIMLALVACYQAFYWWPLHPIGYLATYSSATRILWFSFFVGWLVNQLTLRYGGVELFRRVRYFFFGLILGDFLMGGAFGLLALKTGVSYQVLPD